MASYRSKYGSLRSGYEGNYRDTSVSGATLPSISGLVLDLNAAAGIGLSGSNVATWTDQSGSGAVYTQSGATPPVITAAVFGSLPAVTCTANTSILSTAASPLAAGSARTIFAVVKGGGSAGASGGSVMAFKTTAGSQYIFYFWDLTPNIYCYGNGAISDTITGVTVFNTAHVIMETATVGTLPVVQVDGVAQTVSGANNVTTDNGVDSAAAISLIGASQGFVGHTGRILVYNSVLSAGNIALVKSYLSSTYGIAVT